MDNAYADNLIYGASELAKRSIKTKVIINCLALLPKSQMNCISVCGLIVIGIRVTP